MIRRTDQVSLSAFSYLYSELVQYHQGRVSSLSELEQKLMRSGYGVGFKILELLAYRSKEVRCIGMKCRREALVHVIWRILVSSLHHQMNQIHYI
jgi:hypothetical protein